jgi:hypothetical protein
MAHSRCRPRAGIADVNQPDRVSGAVWGDYDNDGYEDLFLIVGTLSSTTIKAQLHHG